MRLTVLSELIILEEKHNIKTDISDIDKTNAFSLNKRSTENVLLNQTLALKGLISLIINCNFSRDASI